MGRGGDSIGWHPGRMAEMATLLDRRSDRLHEARKTCLDASSANADHPTQLRKMVMAAEWAKQAAAAVRRRRSTLLAAEADLVWQPSDPRPLPRFGPPLRARSTEEIAAELELALDDLERPIDSNAPDGRLHREHRLDVLMYELAVAEQQRLLMIRGQPPTGLLAELAELINYLGYQIARSRHRGAIDWNRVTEALRALKSALDESWFRDVGRKDLQRMVTVIGSLTGPELDAVIALLTDDELYRWIHELDGVRGGNLDRGEEAELFTVVAQLASPATLLRLALAEGGSRFNQIASAVRTAAPVEIVMEFTELCAAGAADSEQLLVGTLAGLAELDESPRRVVITSLHTAGVLDHLATATTKFLERSVTERTQPIIVEFLGGLVSAIRDGAVAMADLTIVGLVDRHRFRAAWSSLASVAGLAVTDPLALVAVIADIETLRNNPSRWLGSMTADLATMGIGKLGRLGRLGGAARAVADLMKRLADSRILRAGRVELQAGHVHNVIGRLTAAADTLDYRALRAHIAEIEQTADELTTLVGELDTLSVGRAIAWLNRILVNVSGRIVALGGASLWTPQMTESHLPAT